MIVAMLAQTANAMVHMLFRTREGGIRSPANQFIGRHLLGGRVHNSEPTGVT